MHETVSGRCWVSKGQGSEILLAMTVEFIIAMLFLLVSSRPFAEILFYVIATEHTMTNSTSTQLE